eukprot:gb/GEZJ01002113.1/.p1 GENE.gb/GEZJ01002113.1/~~gb/GEZJ01002113.1/.p1  ORF type:complete len:123 (-),score=9.71 gb/GEZJ01002113.1/:364-732(-)
MFKIFILTSFLACLYAANGASVAALSMNEAVKLTKLPCYYLEAAARNIAADSPIEVREVINAAIRSCGPIYPPPPPPPRPTSCPCQCTSYEKALDQCKGYSFSKCWLIGPPKCKKGQLSCCC